MILSDIDVILPNRAQGWKNKWPPDYYGWIGFPVGELLDGDHDGELSV